MGTGKKQIKFEDAIKRLEEIEDKWREMSYLWRSL
jgi:hypothetical protein